MSYADATALKEYLRPQLEGDWDNPDRSLADSDLPPAPDLPLPLLRSWGPWIADYAAMKSAPIGYALGAVLAGAAAAIGSSRMIEARPGWRVYPALWVLLVGPPSAHKSPAQVPIVTILKNIEREEAVDFDAERRDYETKRQAANEVRETWERDVKKAIKSGGPAPLKPMGADDPEEPSPPRIVVNDATVEAMAPMLKANPRGVLLERDELAGFIGNIGKYGGDGDAAFWLERYDGAPFSTDRVKRGHVQGDIGLVSILGGIQPERAQELLLNRPDDGFVSRFLLIYPEPARRVWETPTADLEKLKYSLMRLRALTPNCENGRPQPVVLSLCDVAKTYFSEWWIENGDEGRASSGFRAGILGKAPGVVLRLALILELLEWAGGNGAEPTSVSRESLAAAIGLYGDYFLPLAGRVLGGATRTKDEALASVLLKQIRRRRDRTVNAKAVYRNWSLPGLAAAKATNAALEALSVAGWVRPFRDARIGRPRGDWEVNPQLWEEPS